MVGVWRKKLKIWLFATYAWQGNPKALFLYMTKYYQNSHICWWLADTKKDADILKEKYDYNNITYLQSPKAKELFAIADVYVTENFRESYPQELNSNIKIFNMWHGVGLKHIEVGVNKASNVATSVVRKNIKSAEKFINQTIFLTTSQRMEQHFLQDTLVPKEHILQGSYPRNAVYNSEVFTYQASDIFREFLSSYNHIILFAPTHRTKLIGGVFQYLLPNLDILETILKENNQLFIIKVHPFMTKEREFINIKEKYKNNHNILFWNDIYDIYEIFSKIDIAIVDYSSIFYDLLNAGVKKFIRYIPDYEEYNADMEMIEDYYQYTDGVIANSFQHLLNILKENNIVDISKQDFLLDYFFGYEKSCSLDSMIKDVDNFKLNNKKLKELHTFDVFDTLIRRSTMKPISIFYYVQNQAKLSNLSFPEYILNEWAVIRQNIERDVRDIMRKTIFERQSDTLEITLDDIYERLSKNFALTDEQVLFLKSAEIEAEIAHVEPIKEKIDLLFSLKEKDCDILLISDMYLPEAIIRQMLDKADTRLSTIPLYLSSSIGYQKSTGKLYEHIFFDVDYQYSRWVHYGDNRHADGVVPRRYGIQTRVHDIDDFIPFESGVVNQSNVNMKYVAYQLATKMQRYRTSLANHSNDIEREQKYYAYAYVGSALVPYIHWVIKDAIKRGYQTLYFISRDGHYLKQVADKIIKYNGYLIKTKYIYGSRKAWRLPSFINEVDEKMFSPFGNFVGMDCFEDLVRASYLNEDEFLALFPEFSGLKNEKHLRGKTAENIRKILSESVEYRNKVLTIAKNKRVILRKYLQQEINFDESFAFVEFWGRGYTQDTLGRLLNDTAGKSVTNPFYYVRSFTNDTKTSLRHNFMLTNQNFSFFEPIFASTPYESIQEYIETNKGIEPVIIAKENDIHQIISEGLSYFVSDYLNLPIEDYDYLDYLVANYSYNYQLTSKTDQFLCNVFSELTDNISSYGDDKKYAPALTVETLSSISSKQELDKITHSIGISLAKSNKSTKDFYQKMYQKYKLPKVVVSDVQKSYYIMPLSQYVYSKNFPFTVISVKRNDFYADIAFNQQTKVQNKSLNELEVIDVLAIDWTKNGVPRLLTSDGYLTANKHWVQKLEDVDDFIEYDKKEEKYKWKPISTMQKLLEVKPLLEVVFSRVNNTQNMTLPSNNKQSQNNRYNEEFIVFQKKFHKFTRDPYGFFRDVKNPKIAKAKIIFDEKHVVGRKLSNYVRKVF